jgi:hypothetical protein
MKIVFICIAACLTLAACVTISEQKSSPSEARQATDAPQARGALSGQRQLIFTIYASAPDCASLGYPTMKIAKPPQHGQVSVEQGTALASFGRGDARSACNGKNVPATAIYYTSEPGFVGADSVAFDRIGVAGAFGYHAFIINVR